MPRNSVQSNNHRADQRPPQPPAPRTSNVNGRPNVRNQAPERPFVRNTDMPAIQRRPPGTGASTKSFDIIDQLKSTSAKISLAELIKVAPSVRTQAMNHLRGLMDGPPQHQPQPNQQANFCQSDQHEAGFLMDFEEDLINEYACQDRLPGEQVKQRSHNTRDRKRLNKMRERGTKKDISLDLNESQELQQQPQGASYPSDCATLGSVPSFQLQPGARISVLKAQVVINKQRLSVVVDSGATHCMISDTMAKKLMLFPRLRTVNRRFKTADGATSKPLGILPNIPVTLGSTTLPTDLYVCQASNYTMLLGNSFLAPAGIVIDYPKCQLICHPEPGIVEYIPADYQNLGREKAPWVQMEEGHMPWKTDKDSYSVSAAPSEMSTNSLSGGSEYQASEGGDVNLFEICETTEEHIEPTLPEEQQAINSHPVEADFEDQSSAMQLCYAAGNMHEPSINKDLQLLPAIFLWLSLSSARRTIWTS